MEEERNQGRYMREEVIFMGKKGNYHKKDPDEEVKSSKKPTYKEEGGTKGRTKTPRPPK